MSKSTKSLLIVVLVTLFTGLILIAGIGVAYGQPVTNPDSTVTVTTGIDGNDVTVSIRVVTEGVISGADTVYVSLPADTVYIDVPDTVIVREIEYIDRIDTVEIVRFDTTYIDRIVTDTLYVELTDTVYITQIDTVYITEVDTVYIDLPGDTVFVDIPCPACPEPVDPDSLDPDIPDTVDQAARAAYLAAHPTERTLYNWRHDDGAIPADTGIYISRYVRESDQFAFVLYVQPRNTTETGPARYVTISQDGLHRNFTVGQQGRDIEIRFRNTSKSDARNGLPPLMIRGVITDDYIENPDRVLLLYVLYDQGEMSAYVDTEFKVSATYPGNTSTWGDYGMMINDEFTGERASEAVIRQIEFYTFLDEQDLAAKRFWLMHYVMNIATTELPWEPVPGATSYQIQVFSDSEMSQMVADHTTSELMYLFTGGIGQTYWYRVRAANTEQVSDWSVTGTFTVPVE